MTQNTKFKTSREARVTSDEFGLAFVRDFGLTTVGIRGIIMYKFLLDLVFFVRVYV